jgi:hypothetical protein
LCCLPTITGNASELLHCANILRVFSITWTKELKIYSCLHNLLYLNHRPLFFRHELESLGACVLSSSALGSWKFSIQTYTFQILDFPVTNKVEATPLQTTSSKYLRKQTFTVHAEIFRREGITHCDECARKLSCFIQNLSIYCVTLTNWWCQCFFTLQTIFVLSWFHRVCCVFMCVYAIYSKIRLKWAVY